MQLNLLVFGGSQGAQFFSEIMPAALALLPSHMRDRLMVVQQCRAEDLDAVFDLYEAAGVAAELSTFFEDLPQKNFETHLVISRGGASTIAELCAIGRPAIVVPLPHAIDNDQLENARRFEAGGAGWCMEQEALTPERMRVQSGGCSRTRGAGEGHDQGHRHGCISMPSISWRN